MSSFRIGNRLVGDNHPPLVVAELGINHQGSLDLAISLADLAINAGAEVIKHQTHIVEDEMSEEAKLIVPPHIEESIYEVIKKSALGEEEELKLKKYIEARGSIFISTPFSRAAANRLQKFDIPAYKIGSGECNNYPLVKHIAAFGKPIILSTGMNDIPSIKKSVEIFRNAGVPFALLHCTNVYPTPLELVRLDAIVELKKEFSDAVVGLSDHTSSNFTCFGAVGLGASILEKHFTDTKDREGPDISASMDPSDLKELILGSNSIFKSKGTGKRLMDEERGTAAFAFASVVVIQDIEPGEELSPKNIWVKRPSGGDFAAESLEELFGRVANKEIKSGFQLKQTDLK